MKKFFKKVFSFIKRNATIVIIAFIFLFLFICDSSTLRVGNVIMDNLKAIATSFTPTTDLFDDGSEVSFVSHFLGISSVKKEKNVAFYKPCSFDSLNSSDEYLVYLQDGVLCSVANGKVSAVGYTKDNEKYIEIEHSNGYISRYVGVQSVGVSTGEKVGYKNPIAMISSKNQVKVIIQQNGNLIKPSDIKWNK